MKKGRFYNRLFLNLGLAFGIALCGFNVLAQEKGTNNIAFEQQVELSDRERIKTTCQENCACFNNVVDYRLSDEQAYLFAIFMEQLKTRPETNILEFMDEKEARAIQSIFACQKSQLKIKIFKVKETKNDVKVIKNRY